MDPNIADTLSGRYLGPTMRRARFFQVLILVKIVARRVPIYKKEWAATTSRIIERATEILPETHENSYSHLSQR